MTKWKLFLAKTLYLTVPAFFINMYVGFWDNSHGKLSDFASFAYIANGIALIFIVMFTLFAITYPE